MIRTLTALALLAAAASPAAAADIKVAVAGKDAAAVKADIKKAAVLTCRDELRGSVLAFSMQSVCEHAAAADAMAQLAPAPVYASTATPLAVTRISATR